MKLIELRCKNCGSILEANPEESEITCKYCQARFKIDDEVSHVQFDNMEQQGYEFEKGRIRAQQERNRAIYSNVVYTSQPKKNRTGLLILAWIFLFPFTATFFIAKSTKLDKKKKIIIIVIMWIAFIAFAIASDEQKKAKKKNIIVKCYSEETYNKLDELIGIDNITGYFSTSQSCDYISLRTTQYRTIKIEMDGDKLTGIKLDLSKYIYNIDETVDIYDPITLRIKKKDKNAEKLFGPQEGNFYYDNEKSIRRFVTEYNKLAERKVTKVDWKNNHQIATLYFESESCKINTSSFDYVITCEFSDGKAKVSTYDGILKSIIKIYDSNITDIAIDSAMRKGKSNGVNETIISTNVTIKYNYLKERTAFRAADSYILEVVLKKK